jgi:hypothetical protein
MDEFIDRIEARQYPSNSVSPLPANFLSTAIYDFLFDTLVAIDDLVWSHVYGD